MNNFARAESTVGLAWDREAHLPVTQKMIEAGVEAQRSEPDPAKAVEAVYRAMRAGRR